MPKTVKSRETKAELLARVASLEEQLRTSRALQKSASNARYNAEGILGRLADLLNVRHGGLSDYVLVGYDVEAAVLRELTHLNSLRRRERQQKRDTESAPDSTMRREP